jgi:S-formylglutathione hydrolase FrmB
MSRTARLFLLTAAFLTLWQVVTLGTASAAQRGECHAAPSKILTHPVGYCVLLPASYDTDVARRYPVLYFLHGLGGNQQVLVGSAGMQLVEDLVSQKRIGEFLIVTPSAGASFYINSRDGNERYEDFLVKEFFPYIEQRYRIRAERKCRGISGASMGGYGALRLALRFPSLFGSVSAHSAALVDTLPPALINSPESLLGRVLAGPFGSPIDPAFWQRNSPFTLVRNEPKPTGLAIYFDCGTEDDFGFDQGASAFDKLLTSRGIRHEFHLYPGGHGWAYVAEHLDASLAFHSRVFTSGP